MIDVVDFNATTSGQRNVDDTHLAALVQVLSRHRLGLRDVEPDILGRAYEYLLRKFAEGQGQSAGEFYTPRAVAVLMARLLEPSPGMAVYDPCCGSAGLLIKCHLRLLETHGVGTDGHRELPPDVAPLHVHGQEINPATFAIARMNAFIHDMQADIALGDTMRRPAFTTADGRLARFDLVVANPMWNQDFAVETYAHDTYERFAAGAPPASTADWGWVQHMAASLTEDGHLAVVLLPENLFYNTTAPGIILVINRRKAHPGEIVLINATTLCAKGRPKNYLTDDHVARIAELYHDWRAEEGLSAVTTTAEVMRNDANLSPGRYVAAAGKDDVFPWKTPSSSCAKPKRSAPSPTATSPPCWNRLASGVCPVADTALPESDTVEFKESWARVPLERVATLQRGNDPPAQKRMSGIHPVVGSSGVLGYHSTAIASGPGVLIGRSGSVGKVTWVGQKSWALNTALWVKDFHGNDRGFVYLLLSWLDLAKYASGVSVPTLNRNLLHPLLVDLPPELSRVVMSSGFNDSAELAAFHLSDEEEQRIRKAFRKPGEDPQILIVTEKLLTGFDAPILYCLYLDKPMRDHVLLQTIARVNRPYEDADGRAKPAGFVLDFVGIFDRLEQALAFDSEDVQGVIEGLEVLQTRFATLMAEGRIAYLSVLEGHAGDKQVEAALEHFRDRERRDEFYRFFRELEELYEILSPDAFLRPYLADYDELARLYRVLRADFEPHIALDKGFLRKTQELVQQQTRTTALLAPETLDRLAKDNAPDTVKVFNLLRAIQQLVEQEGARQPHLIAIGERCEEIAAAFKDRQATTAETLQALLDGPVQEVQDAAASEQQSRLGREGFTVYRLLVHEAVPDAEPAAQNAADAFARFPHWLSSESQERQVRAELYKSLIGAAVELERLRPIVDHVLLVLRRAADA